MTVTTNNNSDNKEKHINDGYNNSTDTDNKQKQFLRFSFKAITTKYNKDGIEKKVPIGMPNWRSISKTTLHPHHQAQAIIYGKPSNITVFDFDDREEYEKLVQLHPALQHSYRVQTKKGYHLYFHYHPSILTTTDAMFYYKGVDIRNDNSIVFCPPTEYMLQDGTVCKYEYVGGELMDVPEYLLSELKQFQEKEDKMMGSNGKAVDVASAHRKHKTHCQQDEVVQLLKQLHHSRCDNYDSWVQVGLLLHHELGYEEGLEV